VSPRPLIFISAVSRELRSARQLVANTLAFLGYEPIWQEIFGTESGDLREVLRQKIDQCKGVVQLVGQCYGAEPLTADEQFGRVSYTQYEALYARQRGKKVWFLFIDEDFPIDANDPEPAELRELQADYRRRVKADSHLFHSLNSREALEAGVLKLRDDLTRLRRGVKQWAAGVAILLVVSVGIGVWLLRGQRQTNQEMHQIAMEMTKLRQGVVEYPKVDAQVRKSQVAKDPAAVQEQVYAELGKQLGFDPKGLREMLPRLAENLKNAPDATNYERASAAYVSQDYAEAERLSMQAADDARRSAPAKPKDALRALSLGGWSAQKNIQYARAMEHFREAEKLTDPQRNPEDWAQLHQAIAGLLIDQGQYKDARNILLSVVELRTRLLGAEHPDTLRSRGDLATALDSEGNYAEAENQYRDLIKLDEKVFGSENSETLSSRNGLAILFMNEGKYGDAEAEYRQLANLAAKVLGADHPDTLRNLNDLASAINSQGRFTEAETQYRDLIKTEERVFGPEDPSTLTSRGGFANSLSNQGKFAEAEAEYRDVLRLREKVLGAEHPDTLTSRNNLAAALSSQGKHPEAEAENREVLRIRTKVLGPEHPDTLSSRNNLANNLANQHKYPDAESEFRALITLEEKVLGPQHPDTLRSCFNLALDLARQSKFREAKQFAGRATEGARKVLGAEHPSTRNYDKLLQALVKER
jgi:tetratricopeptide (TPR) repeat protein